MTDTQGLADAIYLIENGEFPADASASSMGLGAVSQAHGLPVIKRMYEAFSGSLDGALALHEAILPRWQARPIIGAAGAEVTCWHCTVEHWDDAHEIHAYNHPSPARAWLLAILYAVRDYDIVPMEQNEAGT